MTTVLKELEQLPVAERMLLVEDLWDSIARSAAEPTVPQWQRDELDRRKALLAKEPDAAVTWEEAKRSILAGR